MAAGEAPSICAHKRCLADGPWPVYYGFQNVVQKASPDNGRSKPRCLVKTTFQQQECNNGNGAWCDKFDASPAV